MLKEQGVSLSGASVLGVNSTVARLLCLKGHVRARRLDAVMTPVDKKQMNSGGYRHLFCEGVQKQKSWPKKPRDASSDTLVMSSF